MNDSELNDLLKSACVPERPADYWEKFPGRVMKNVRSRQRRRAEARSFNSYWTLLRTGMSALRQNHALAATGFVVVAVALATTFVGFKLLTHKRLQANAQQLREAQKYFHELDALFPNQLQAIELDQSGPRFVLAKDATVPNSPPLYLKICGPEKCQRFITFSGQQIRVNGESYDVLIDRQGHVLLVGRDTIWSDSESAGKAGSYRIEATPLKTTT